tara:strand:- start:38 stop:646 length:609 start_codon:yes stop_codon:yes gene_type:complete
MTDFEIAGKYVSVVSEILNELPVGSTVAWLGQKHPSVGEDKFLYDSIMSGVNNELKHDFYDLNNEESGNSFKWDVHSEWKIKGYDLVLGMRILYLCDSREALLENLKNISSSNDRVVFDFMTGNPALINGKETFIKRNNSQTILPFFPELYDGEYSVQPNHSDQVVLSEDMNKSGIEMQNIMTFRDTIKRRFYTICEVSCDA